MSTSETEKLNDLGPSLDALQAEISQAGDLRAVAGSEETNIPPAETYTPAPTGAALGYPEALTGGSADQDKTKLTVSAALGPFHCDIRFGGGIPVGGWSQLTLHSNGAWNFTGHLHDSGAPSYNDVVTWGVQSVRTGDVYVVRHTGHMAGTFEPGSRNDDWGDSGINPALGQGWDALAPAWRWHCRAYVNWDFAGAVNQLLQIIAAGQAIGRVVMLF
jgi:hypothetical protein